MNPSFSEYHIPVHMDVPDIDVIWTDIPDPHAPMGSHGIGEMGITGVGAFHGCQELRTAYLRLVAACEGIP